MDEIMIERWNKVVKPLDHIWHGGDVTWRYDGCFNNIMSRLNGKKRLVIGNHDKLLNPNLFKWFEKVELWRGFKEHNFTLVHMPIPLPGLRDGDFCVHGHTHANQLEDKHYINICVEIHNYTPIHLDEIRMLTK
jgi:calcineurin-like phosphoesterase family protein